MFIERNVIQEEPSMDQSNHHGYYRTRAETSRELAQRAVHPGIAAIHSEFASRYDSLVAELERNGTAESVQAG